MENIKQKAREMFDEKFKDDRNGKNSIGMLYIDATENKLKSFKEILEGVKKFMEDNKRLENNPEGYDGIQDTYVIDVDDTINYLEEIIKKL